MQPVESHPLPYKCRDPYDVRASKILHRSRQRLCSRNPKCHDSIEKFPSVRSNFFLSRAYSGCLAIMNTPLNDSPDTLTLGGVSDVSADAIEFQVTDAQRDHVLTNVNIWSPDSQRIVFDVRTSEEFNGTTIEEVEIATRRVSTLFECTDGAHCGVATYSPAGPWVAFILGPEHPSEDWHYSVSRRRGALVDIGRPGSIVPLDAMNYGPPFAPGALRGGSHVHVFSPDGLWVSFTYDDDVLNRLGTDGADHDLNQRNIGVAFPAGPVSVAPNHARNHGGAYFSVIVTRTFNRPRPGSDEICRACEEGWVGNDGYVRANGVRQKRALAFQGLVVAAGGDTHAEVFIADLPEDLTIPGDGPLAGTERRYPRPPLGTTYRRLTFSSGRKYPGVATVPRHWIRSAPDGSRIASLMKDENGIVQLWWVSPNGGEPRQLTRSRWNIDSAFTWSPNGRWIAHAMDNSVFATDAITGHSYRLTARSADSTAPLPLACVFSPDGQRIAYLRKVGESEVHSQIFVVSMPAI